MVDIKDAIVTNVNLSAKGKFKKALLLEVTDTVDLELKSDITFELSFTFENTLNKMIESNFKSIEISEIKLKTDAVFINFKKESIIKLKELSIYRGGKVKVHSFEPLNILSNLEATESVIMLIGFLMVFSKSSSSSLEKRAYLNQKSPNDFESVIIRGLTLSTLQNAISNGFLQVIKENKNIISGFDLEKAFGIKK